MLISNNSFNLTKGLLYIELITSIENILRVILVSIR
jgi:hypothetical protein